MRITILFLLIATIPASAAERGLASTYRDTQVSCDGESYSAKAMTAAHRTLPCGTVIKVTNLANGRSAVLRIIDRGPCADPPSALCIRLGLKRIRLRILDLTPAAAIKIGSNGMPRVVVEIQN